MAFLKIVFIILFFFNAALASEKESTFFKTASSDIASPLTTSAKYIFIPGVLVTSLAYFTRSHRNYAKRQTFKEAKPLGDFGFLGEYIGYGVLNIGYAGFSYWLGKKNSDPVLLKNAEVMARASLLASGWTLLGKATISERRPGYPDDENSFPSGHASGAFSFASVVTAQHGWGWGGAAYGLAGLIAISRINDDFHYLHDILAGITIGASYGWGVHYNAEKGNNYWMTLMPVRGKGMGFALGKSF